MKKLATKIKKNIRSIQNEIKKNKTLIDKTLDMVKEAEAEITAQQYFDWVEPYRNVPMKDVNFDKAKEDYNKTVELYEETKQKALDLKAQAKEIEQVIRSGNNGDEMFDKYYQTMRDAHQAFGIEIALLNRKASASVLFWDKITKTFPQGL